MELFLSMGSDLPEIETIVVYQKKYLSISGSSMSSSFSLLDSCEQSNSTPAAFVAYQAG